MISLFRSGSFLLHAGGTSDFKIDCDALSDKDIKVLAAQLAKRLPTFRINVYGVPRGGLRLAVAMEQYGRVEGPRLVVDDVYTTGTAIHDYASYQCLAPGEWIGAVLFARSPTPPHIIPLFSMTPELVKRPSDSL